MSRALKITSLLVLAALATGGGPAGGASKSKSYDQFARCLTEKKATMYGTFWCEHCEEQKELFGRSFQYVTYFECAIPGTRRIKLECKALGIRRTPTWIFSDGERRERVQPLEDLSKKTGCALP